MIERRISTDGGPVVHFMPEVSSSTAPEIIDVYMNDGIRMYRTKDGREFIADKYDESFRPAVKMQVKPKGFKGFKYWPHYR